MKHILVFLLWLYLLPQALAGGMIHIKASFPGGEGQEVRLMLEVDPLSKQSKEVDATFVNSDESFSFSFHAEGVARYFLRIRHSYNYFLAEPGNVLQMTLEMPAEGSQPLGPAFMRLRQNLVMELRNLNQEQEDLNSLDDSLGEIVATYLEHEVAPRVRVSHRQSLQALMQRTDSVFQGVEHPFFKASLVYQMAYLESALLTSPGQQLIIKYLHNQPILYDHPCYMDFFSAVIDSYVFTGSRHCPVRDLQHAVNRKACFQSLSDCLAEDPVFSQAELRELSMIRALQSMLYRDDFDPAKVLSVLDQWSLFSTFDRHRKIASAITGQYTAIRAGSPAPGLTLRDQEDTALGLEDLRGQYVYLFFGASWCPVSMAEMRIVKEMAQALEDHLTVLVVLLDDEWQEEGSWSGHGQKNLLVLPFGEDYRLLDAYRIRSTPQYFLIGPDGYIIDRDFPAPSAGAAGEIQRIIDG